MHQSVATIHSPEFINLKPLDINPLMSSCEIKVLYIGENRNRSYISKEVATEMAKTLRGAPIVGYYREDKGDFADHGDRVIIDDEGIRFECMTKPYGFVSPDAKVWFQKFEEVDEFGNVIIREYLMTTGFLWTGQFEEAQQALEGDGQPHSMELDEKTLNGEWSKSIKRYMELFIINDAIFSKLCILGEDVEPCFEGSSVKAPEVSASFTKVDNEFKNTLYSMMQQLQYALKGGQEEMQDVTEAKISAEEQVKVDEVNTAEIENSTEDTSSAIVEAAFAKKEDEEKPADDKKDEAAPADDKKDEKPAEDKKDEEDEDKKKKFSLEDYEELSTKYSELESKYTALEQMCEELTKFKNQVEDDKKDALIKSFCMLSDEDKKDVIENKSKYSLDDIEAKLSVICVRKKVNFNLEEESEETPEDNIEDESTDYSDYNLETEEDDYSGYTFEDVEKSILSLEIDTDLL